MEPSSGWRRTVAAWWPALLVVLLVAGEGTRSFSIGKTSEWFYPFWMHHFAKYPMQRFWDFNELLRKLGHLAGYATVFSAFFLSWLLWLGRRAWNTELDLRNRAAGMALACALCLAIADELHQRFIPGRTSTIADIGMDMSGAYLAAMVLLSACRHGFFDRWTNRQTTPSES